MLGAMQVGMALSGCASKDHRDVFRDRVAARDGAMVTKDGVTVELNAAAGASYLATVEQLDFDATLEFVDGDGKLLASAASPARGLGREYLLWTCDKARTVRLAIHSVASPASSAHYRAEIWRLPPTLSPAALSALHSMSRSSNPQGAPTRAVTASVTTELETAEAYWRSQRLPRLAADAALQLAGRLYFVERNWAKSLAAAQRAVVNLATQRDAVSLAGAELLQGAALQELAEQGDHPESNYAAAYESFARSRADYQAQHLPGAAATVLLYEGSSHYGEGNLDRSIAAYRQADAEFAAVGDRSARTFALTNIAAVRLSRGEYREAAASLEAALPLMQDNDPNARTDTLLNYASALTKMGHSEQALQQYLSALDIARSRDSASRTAFALTGLGYAHLQLGQPGLAATYFDQAIELVRNLGDPDRLAVVLSSLGDAYARQGKTRAAIKKHREAIAALSASATPMRHARLALALANDLTDPHNALEAKQLYSAIIGSQPALQYDTLASALVGRGRLNRNNGRLDDAQRDITQALALARDSGTPERLILAMQEQALIARQRGDFAEALRVASTAVDELAHLQRITAGPDNRMTLTANLRSICDLQIDLLAENSQRAATRDDQVAANHLALQALSAVERHAELADGYKRDNSRTDDAVTETLYQALAGKRQRLTELADRQMVATPAMQALQQEAAVLQSRLASRGPSAGAGAIAPLHATARHGESIRMDRVPDKSVVLVFRLGVTRSWLWVISKDRLAMHALPPRGEVDRLVDDLLRSISALNSPAVIDSKLAALRSAILPSPWCPSSCSNLIVLPDGAIGAVPWALLARDAHVTVTEIASLRSLLPPDRSRPAIAQFNQRLATPLRVALLGDPVFGGDDPRLQRPAVSAEESATSNLHRLIGSGAELDAISRIGPTSIVLRRTGLLATRAAVLNVHSDSVDILHLATHASLDADVPALAAIVMSRVDANGHYQSADLRSRDILGIEHPPPLVVLSACDTAVEPSRSAPGLMNLSGAFLAAGSEYVLASLWPVSDAGAVAFMTEFYRGLLQQRLTPAVALASAQALLAKSDRFADPFFWSGFVLIRESL